MMATDTTQNSRILKTAGNIDTQNLNLVSYNMHGFYQGFSVVDELIKTRSPDVFLLQEHWLTPDNLYVLDKYFANFFSFGCSAMSKRIESGMLTGRPFGGVVTLINNRLRNITQTVHCDERFSIVKIADVVIVNVYLPCQGTQDRIMLCDDLLAQISSWCDRYSGCDLIVAGDFNCCLDSSSDPVSHRLNNFISRYMLQRCDVLFPSPSPATYINEALNQHSYIDYILITCQNVYNFAVLEPEVNFSDHLPLFVTLALSTKSCDHSSPNIDVVYPRWDKADIGAYYGETGANLTPLLSELDKLLNYNEHTIDKTLAIDIIDQLYERIVFVMRDAESRFVPKHRKNYYKFWWNEELTVLKQASVESDRAWKAVGRPRSGAIFNKRQQCRLLYRKRLKDCQMEPSVSYSNDLHDALLRKNSTLFWKCWRSKFDTSNRCVEVEQMR